MIFNQILYTVRSLPFKNLDLLSVGVVIASIGILGFVIYINNKKSETNRSFLYFSLATIVWSIFNYLNYQSSSPEVVLWLLRMLMFSAVWFSFTIFQLLRMFPRDTYTYPHWHKYFVLPWTGAVSILALSPFVFDHIIGTVQAGTVAAVQIGPGIVIFAITVLLLIGSGIWSLIKKIVQTKGADREKLVLILGGVIITFALIIGFDFINAAFLGNYQFIPYGALFVFPFVVSTAYAIYKHHLFNIRAATVVALTFILTISMLVEVIFSTSTVVLVLRGSIFLLVLWASILMNRFVETIAEQREELELANQGQANLIHIINHQIKGYLAKSRNIFAELLSDGSYGPISSEARPMLEEGLKSLGEGVDFVQQVLNSSSAEKGTLAYVMEPIDFKAVVEEMFDHEKPEAVEKNLAYDLKIDEANYQTKGDFVQLKEAVRNLITNSIIYTPSGSVSVHLSHPDHKLVMTVTDTGVGLSDEDRQRLFTKGGRGKDSLKVNVNSTGYGLSFVKAVIEAHKGRVSADSQGRSKGSVFSLELPIS
jgi:signal transduction histidine kinase